MKSRRQKLKENIWKYYLYRVFSTMLFVFPILVLYLQENGLSMTQVMLLHTMYSLVIMVSIVPSGIVADYIGRKKVIIGSNVLFFFAWLAYGSSYTFTQFLGAEVLFGLSGAMWTAAGSAFFYDSLKEIKEESKFKKLYGNVAAINYVGWGLSSIVGSILAVNGFRQLFFYTAIPIFISIFIAMSFTETKLYKHSDKKYLLHLKKAVKYSANHKKIRFLIVYTAVVIGICFSVNLLYQPYLNKILVPLAYFGLVYFGMNIMSAIGSKIAHGLDIKLGENKVLSIILVMIFTALAGMYFELVIVGAIFPIVIAFFFGIFDVSITDYINKHVKSFNRATITSLTNLVGYFANSILAPFLGVMVDLWSLKTAFMFSSVLVLITLVGALIIFKNGKS